MRLNIVTLIAAAILSFSIADLALATPAFSRQIDADCRTCHFQDMHALNKFGREFKQNGFNLSRHMRQQIEKIKKKPKAE